MEVKVNHLYRHYKGDLYLVEAIAKDSTTLQQSFSIEEFTKIVPFGQEISKSFEKSSTRTVKFIDLKN